MKRSFLHDVGLLSEQITTEHRPLCSRFFQLGLPFLFFFFSSSDEPGFADALQMHCASLRASSPQRRPSQTLGPDAPAGSTRCVALNSRVAASICGKQTRLVVIMTCRLKRTTWSFVRCLSKMEDLRFALAHPPLCQIGLIALVFFVLLRRL